MRHTTTTTLNYSLRLLPYRLHHIRTFINARIKWVRDPYLDMVVEREKNLKQILSLKEYILSSSSPKNSLSLSSASLLKPRLNLPFPTAKFVSYYPSFFSISHPKRALPPQLTLTREALRLQREESAILYGTRYRDDAVKRLAKLLMIARAGKLPLFVIEKFRYDLGLPCNFVLTLLCDYPEYFDVCSVGDDLIGLELVCWRKELAVSVLEEKFGNGKRIGFPMSFPNGFDLEKRIKVWVEEWQNLPYISPYEDAFHLAPSSDQAEKWTVAVLHEVLWLLASKKTERDNLFCLGEYLGFGTKRIEKALKHHPGIFYVSNKIRTQTVVLREAFRKDFLLEKHPMIGMRYRYIHLLNKVDRRRTYVKKGSNLGIRRRDSLIFRERN